MIFQILVQLYLELHFSHHVQKAKIQKRSDKIFPYTVYYFYRFNHVNDRFAWVCNGSLPCGKSSLPLSFIQLISSGKGVLCSK